MAILLLVLIFAIKISDSHPFSPLLALHTWIKSGDSRAYHLLKIPYADQRLKYKRRLNSADNNIDIRVPGLMGTSPDCMHTRSPQPTSAGCPESDQWVAAP
jgi:hypothetical protein